MITGARQGVLSGVRRWLAAAMALDLGAFIIPGSEIARAHGLDIETAGLQKVSSPRHASVLIIVGDLPAALRDSAAVIFSQMMRPRALFVLGAKDISPLPPADIVVGLSQQELVEGVRQLRTLFRETAFRCDVSDFDAPALQIRIEYVCPMHPQVIQDKPGSCPRCGMNLMPRETQATHGDSHADHQTSDMAEDVPASAQSHHSQHNIEDGAAVEYTCPMHPEVVQSEPGNCPKCGMFLEAREKSDKQDHDGTNHHGTDHSGMDHSGMDHSGMDHSSMNHSSMDHSSMNHSGMDHSSTDHDDMGFMSMIDVTKDLPRSNDGLPMEWISAPFGPFFPGLPGGLLLTLSLDGDTVAGSEAQSLFDNIDLLQQSPVAATSFVDRLSGLDPMAPISYRLLACQALENAAGVDVPAEVTYARIGGLERERIASHLNWLVLFGEQTGFDWLMQQAASLQLMIQQAYSNQIVSLQPDIISMIKRLQYTPLLKSRTVGIGRLMPDAKLSGPVARACGINNDVRAIDTTFTTLGFTSASRKEGDVFARLQVRLEEMKHSFALIKAAADIALPVLIEISDSSGEGEAVVETPRGRAHLKLTLEQGRVVAAQLETPSTHHLTLIETLTEQLALADALVAVGSLDLSAWEIQQ